jgi:hypothetical protein
LGVSVIGKEKQTNMLFRIVPKLILVI